MTHGDDDLHEYARIEGIAGPHRHESPAGATAYVEDLISEETRLREMAAEERREHHHQRLRAIEHELEHLTELLHRRRRERSGG